MHAALLSQDCFSRCDRCSRRYTGRNDGVILLQGTWLILHQPPGPAPALRKLEGGRPGRGQCHYRCEKPNLSLSHDANNPTHYHHHYHGAACLFELITAATQVSQSPPPSAGQPPHQPLALVTCCFTSFAFFFFFYTFLFTFFCFFFLRV